MKRPSRSGPRALGAILPPVTRVAFRRMSPDGAQLLADWRAAVGPALADVTLPRKLYQGTLTIACGGPVAMELQHLAPQLLARINGHLGRQAVARLRFVHDPAVSRPRRPAPAGQAPTPPPLRAAMEQVPDAALRAALEKLVAGVYRKRP